MTAFHEGAAHQAQAPASQELTQQPPAAPEIVITDKTRAGINELIDRGVPESVARIVVQCPDPSGAGAYGTLGDLMASDIPQVRAVVTGVLDAADSLIEKGVPPDVVNVGGLLETTVQGWAVKDGDGGLLRAEVPPAEPPVPETGGSEKKFQGLTWLPGPA